MAFLPSALVASAFIITAQASPLAGRDAATPVCSAWPYRVAQSFASYAPFQSFCSSRFPVAAVTVISTVTPDPTTSVTTVFATDVTLATSISVETDYFTSMVATATELAQKRAVLRRASSTNGTNAFLSTACSCIETPATTYVTVTADASTVFETETSIVPSTSIVVVPSTTTVEVDITTVLTVSSPTSDTSTSETSTSETSASNSSPTETSTSDWSTSSSTSEISSTSSTSDVETTTSSTSDSTSSTSTASSDSTAPDTTTTSSDSTSSTTETTPTATDSTTSSTTDDSTSSTTTSESTTDSSTVSTTSESTTDFSSTSTTTDSTTSTPETTSTTSDGTTTSSTTSSSTATSSTPTPTPSNLVTNGAFDGAVDGIGSVPYWSHSGNITVGRTQAFAHSKTQYGDFHSVANASIPQISQTIWSTTSGAAYFLTFYYMPYNISGIDTLSGEYCDLTVSFGNQTLPDIKFSDNVLPATSAVYIQYGPVAVPASQDAAVLGLAWDCASHGGGNADGELYVDDISLTAA